MLLGAVRDLHLDAGLFVDAFVTVLVILDPIGNVPVFLALTRRNNVHDRATAALIGTLVAAGVILVFAVFGQQVLRALGISIEALEVAGGLILALVALELLQHHGPPVADEDDGAGAYNIALVPLGTPLLAGPGAIAATMVYMRQAENGGQIASVVAAVALALAVVYVALRNANRLARLLKQNGIALLSQIVGLLLAAIAVQLVATGIESWVRHGV